MYQKRANRVSEGAQSVRSLLYCTIDIRSRAQQWPTLFLFFVAPLRFLEGFRGQNRFQNVLRSRSARAIGRASARESERAIEGGA